MRRGGNCDMIAFLQTAGQGERMRILPATALPRVTQSAQTPTRATFDRLDHVIVIVPQDAPTSAFRGLPQSQAIKALLARTEPDRVVSSRLPNRRGTGLTVSRYDRGSRFAQLTWARKLVAAASTDQPKQVGIYAVGLDNDTDAAVSAVLAALFAAAFAMPCFKSAPNRHWSP